MNRFTPGLILVLLCSASTAHAQTKLLEFDFNEQHALAYSNAAAPVIATFKDQDNNVADLHSAAGTGVGGGFAFNNTASTKHGGGGVGGALHGALPAPTTLKAMTITGWMNNVSAQYAEGARIMFFRNGAGDVGPDLMWDGSGRLRLDLKANIGGAGSPAGAYAQATSSWTFFAVTFDGGTKQVRFYVGQTANAVSLVGQSTVGESETTLPGPFGIGNAQDGWGFGVPFDGMLDNIRLYGSTQDSTGVLGLAQLETIRKHDLLNRGPVARWKLDENGGYTSADDSLFANTLTRVGGASWSQLGVQRAGILLDGSTGYLRAEDSNSLDLTDKFTISAWVKPTRTDALQTLVSKDGVGADTTGAYNLYLTSGGGVQFEINNRANGSVYSALNLIRANTWHHIAMTHDASASPTTRLYVDGLEVGSGSLPAPSTLTTRLMVGRRGVGSYFSGYVDQLELFNTTLTAFSVRRLFARDRMPVVAFVTPFPAQLPATNIVLQAAAADDLSIREVEFRLDGATVGVDKKSPYEVTFDPSALSNGAHTLEAIARDSGGNLSGAYDFWAERRVIEWGWDHPTTQEVLDNYAQFEQRPLDGFGIKLDDNLSFAAFNNVTRSTTAAQRDIQNMAAALFSRPMDTFAVMYASTQAFPTVPDWFDEAQWATPLSNIALLAKVAKDGKMKGVLFDPETYGDLIFDYESQDRRNEKSSTEYKAQARVMGRKVMQALNASFPDLTLVCTYGFALENKKAEYDLLASFLTGMIEAASNATTIHELGEDAYGYTSDQQYTDLRARLLAQAYTSLGNTDWLRKYFIGMGKWLDFNGGSGQQFQWQANVGSPDNNYYPPLKANAHSAGWQEEIMAALSHADRYAWVYSERLDWWKNVDLPSDYLVATREGKRAAVTSPIQATMTFTISH